MIKISKAKTFGKRYEWQFKHDDIVKIIDAIDNKHAFTYYCKEEVEDVVMGLYKLGYISVQEYSG